MPDADAPPDGPREEKTVALVATRASGTFLVTLPFDGDTGFHAPCAESPASGSKDLESHPTLPYVYSVSAGLEGFALKCTGPTKTTLGPLGASRAIQRVVLSPTGDVGFFSFDGAGAIGVGRFVVGSGGIPTVTDMQDGPGGSSAMLLDATNKSLILAGSSALWTYVLSTDLNITGATSGAPACPSPTGVDLEGDAIFEFCSDSSTVRTFARSPLLVGPDAGMLGAADLERPLPGAWAVVARSTPPSVALVQLGASVTAVDSKSIASEATAMGASLDGHFVATARPSSATESIVELYAIESASLRLVGSVTVSGAVSALAVAPSLTQ